jgi:ribosomal protein L17
MILRTKNRSKDKITTASHKKSQYNVTLQRLVTNTVQANVSLQRFALKTVQPNVRLQRLALKRFNPMQDYNGLP